MSFDKGRWRFVVIGPCTSFVDFADWLKWISGGRALQKFSPTFGTRPIVALPLSSSDQMTNSIKGYATSAAGRAHYHKRDGSDMCS